MLKKVKNNNKKVKKCKTWKEKKKLHYRMLSGVADNILFRAGLLVLIYIDSNILKSLLLHESIISK